MRFIRFTYTLAAISFTPITLLQKKFVMKRRLHFLSSLLFVVLTSCVVVPVQTKTAGTAGNSGKVPPGQMKKATGSQSAKPFAPGQQKKK
jgi:hypothetical protein